MVAAPLFSVIVPTFGRPRFLTEAVTSVLEQTVTDLECVVVDDGGPDSPEVPQDPRIRVIRRPANGGASEARNTGLAEARGRYVTFLDDDDRMEPGRLELALEGLDRAPLAVCWWQSFGKGSTATWSRTLEGDVHDVILDDVMPHLGCAAIRADLAPRFDPRFRVKEDADWWLRATRGVRVATVPGVGYRWRKHPGPRLMADVRARLEGHRLLLNVHASYFDAHPRAAAYQWERVGRLALSLRDRGLARRAFFRAYRLGPGYRRILALGRVFAPRMSVARPPTLPERRP